jgi:hypothetical protein
MKLKLYFIAFFFSFFTYCTLANNNPTPTAEKPGLPTYGINPSFLNWPIFGEELNNKNEIYTYDSQKDKWLPQATVVPFKNETETYNKMSLTLCALP